MEISDSCGSFIQVLLVGGGFVMLEAILALRALFAERTLITLVSPEPYLLYRPPAAPAAFVEGFPAEELQQHASHRYDLRAICGDLGVTYRCDRLDAIAGDEHFVRLAAGGEQHYDVLILALGTRPSVAVPGALTFRDQRDVHGFRRLLAEARAGDVGHLVFAIPSGHSWPLPLYELALLSATYARRHRLGMEISFVTPELAPLELFGREASELVAGVLIDRGVRFRGGCVPASFAASGTLALHFDGDIKADRLLAAPQLRAPRVAGLPGDWWGFVATDTYGRVRGLCDVYAAGSMTTAPLKLGVLPPCRSMRSRIASPLCIVLPLPRRRPLAYHSSGIVSAPTCVT